MGQFDQFGPPLGRHGHSARIVEIRSNVNCLDPAQLAAKQPLRVEIQNGTKINGLALRTSEYLESLGYEVIKLGNAPTQDYQKTVIYDVTASDPSTAAASRIGELLDAGVAPALPEWVTATSSQKVNSRTDILIILGQDRQDEL